MSIEKMTIRLRLALGFGLLIGFMAVVAATSLLRLSQFNRGVANFASARVPKLVAATTSVEAMLQTSRQMRDVLIFDAEKEIKATLVAVRDGEKERAEILNTFAQGLEPGAEKDLYQAIVDAHSQYKPHEDNVSKNRRGRRLCERQGRDVGTRGPGPAQIYRGDQTV